MPIYLDTSNDIVGKLTLLEQMADERHLLDAFHEAKKGCDWKNSVQEFDELKLYYVRKLHLSLINRKYKPKPYYEFTLNERGKTRDIKACHISDRVVQKSLCKVINPILKKYLIYDNGASLPNKGMDFTRNRILYHLDSYYKEYGTNEGYILQIDFSKFFQSIPHEALLKSLYEKLPDDSVNWLLETIINSFDGDRGVGIGSELSQICGLFYPHKIDNYCKIVRSLKYYARYMDDIYIIYPDKVFLQELLEEIIKIADSLGLTINKKKTHINKINKTFVFLKIKYRMLNNGHIIKKLHTDSIVRERRRLKAYKFSNLPYKTIENGYKSWRGGVIKYDSKKSIYNLDKRYNEFFIDDFLLGNMDGLRPLAKEKK